jgi:hypothetical protein
MCNKRRVYGELLFVGSNQKPKQIGCSDSETFQFHINVSFGQDLLTLSSICPPFIMSHRLPTPRLE